MWDHLPVDVLVSAKRCGSWRRTLDQIRQLPETTDGD
jgi:hypothetical protein